MDLEIIKTVLNVARLKSFSAAAFAVPCAQSSVSRRVDAAEKELNTKIFVRPGAGSSRDVSLTPQGEEILRAMVKIVDAYTQLYQAADPTGAAVSLLNLGMRRNMMAPMGTSLMKADFFEQHPGIGISVRTDDFDALLCEFRMRRLDAVLFCCADLEESRFKMRPDEKFRLLGTSRLSVGAMNAAIFNGERARLSDLKDMVFLLNSDPRDAPEGITFSNQQRFCKVCRAAGFEPEIRSIPNNMLEIRYKLAIEGQGVFPSHTPRAWREIEGIRYVSVEDSDFSANYYLLYAQGRKEREIGVFADFFSEHLE